MQTRPSPAPWHVEVYAGTAGHSAWFSADLGQHWVHPNSHSGMYLEARVWGFSSHPARPRELLAATDMGVFRWSEDTARWTPLPSPMNDVWALAQAPWDADCVIAGTRPANLYLSRDGGTRWQKLDVPGIAHFSNINMGPTRVTQILFDPVDEGTVWATIEIGGIFRSTDGGLSWQACCEGLVSQDVHGIAAVNDGQGGKRLLATTNRGLHVSTDNGAHWQFQALDAPWQYCRAVVPQPGKDAVVYLCNGDGPPGSTGRLWRSQDHGRSWSPLALPGSFNSTPWCLALHAHDPQLIFLATNLGQLYRSQDGGEHWQRLPHEFGEIRALHWRASDYPSDRPAHSITVRPPVVAAA